MRFDYSQQMKLGQHMKLAPRMIQSMEILQMPMAELEERIGQELESNATLEIAEEGRDARELAQGQLDAERDARDNERSLRVDENGAAADFERLESFESSNPEAFDQPAAPRPAEREWSEPGASRQRTSGDRDAKMDAMAAAPARQRSLTEQLLEQWSLADPELRLRAAGALIISFLDEDGYLRMPLETIADRAPAGWNMAGHAEPPASTGATPLGTQAPHAPHRAPPQASPHAQSPAAAAAGTPTRARPTSTSVNAPSPSSPPQAIADATDKPPVELLRDALAAVQRVLEPPGIAARDARECLLLQLDAIERERGWAPPALQTARLLIEDHLDDLRQNRLPRIVENTGLDLAQIKAGIERMKGLSLAPARRLVAEENHAIVPDAIVEYDEDRDRYIAYLNESRLPNLQLNREYARMARDKAVPKRDREFLRTNLGNAQWLIDAVQQRKQTLLRVVGVVVEAQRDFFDYGPAALKPLPMTQVAEQLGIHVATVSRAVADKYLLTPRGVVPLRKFFTGGLSTESGQDMSYDAVRAALQEVVAAEDKSKPLSDEAIVDELKRRGIEIARRTVAKYREQLGIPAARLRKTF